jgi:hypothetical protein
MSRGKGAPAREPAAAIRLPALRAPPWSAAAWGAIALTTAFLALAWWWLTQDHGVPATEPGATLSATLAARDVLAAGDLLGPLRSDAIHPPFPQLVGAVGMLLGGTNVRATVLAHDLVFVPLLALGCYQTAKLAAGPRAGLLATAFALGSPLVVEQFHVPMVDAPDAALVAVTVWLILASERFARVPVAALAGVAAGLGLATKQQFPFFVAGLVAVVLVRGGWRNWRGVAACALAALVVGGPWYAIHFSELGALAHAPVVAATPGTLLPRLSLANLGFYLWTALNSLLFAPLFAFAAVGVATAAVEVVRRPSGAGLAPELLGGLLGAWIALLITPIHVGRYLLPAIVYLAVLGTVWIVRRPPRVRALATGALTLALGASVLAASFGVGGVVRVELTGHPAPEAGVLGIPPRDAIVLHSDRNFLVSGPRRGDDVLDLFEAMRRDGVQLVGWIPTELEPRFYDHYGLDALAALARLGVLGNFDPRQLPPQSAVLVRHPRGEGVSPCIRLADGSGVWAWRERVVAGAAPDYCPLRRPAAQSG